MGAALLNESRTFLTGLLLFIQRFFPRLIDGLLLGYLFRFLFRHLHVSAACSITGFMAAFINTALFMSCLVLLFQSFDYMHDKMAGRAFFAYVAASVGVNGLIEMGVSTVLVGAIGYALYKAGLIKAPQTTNKAGSPADQ